jgi:hypothetical protein
MPPPGGAEGASQTGMQSRSAWTQNPLRLLNRMGMRANQLPSQWHQSEETT